MVLKPYEAKKFYDRFGKKQDSQSFYEDKATDNLIVHGDFFEAAKVFEFGCGTGRTAEKLLKSHLPVSATYTGCDLSSTMVGLAKQRLSTFSQRVQIIQTDGTIHFPVSDSSVDRVVSAYVLDLLSETDIRTFLHEAYRVMNPGGKLGLVSLTRGVAILPRIVTVLWDSIFRVRPSLVGGCRPIQLIHHLDIRMWQVEYHRVITAFGIPSEVLVAAVKSNSQP
jgi:ubiquinone/menaquinone biosynthesis C-methylase UbiE